jgi:DNA helicase-2/ATP-dependent DNA helicase PcrA
MDTLTGLTERQKAAVAHMEGPMLVLAGPGSGKTRVITHRIAHLISKGVPPSAILAVTFTNKAAEEMKNRLQNMRVPRGSTLCTFHGLCARLLREFADKAGLPPGFTIYDQADQKSVLNEVLKERDLDPGDYSPARLLRQIGVFKNRMITPEKIGPDTPSELPAGFMAEIYAAYQKRLAAAGALDFDDLLMKAARLFKDNPDIETSLGRRYRYILVDEYQDTNRCQYRIARDLARVHSNLFVTGDPDQSIYGWRGADIENILDFEKDFPGSPVIRLEENFRSTPEVLRLADSLIRANVRRKDKRLVPRKPGGSRPLLYKFADEYEEARGVAAWIRWMNKGFGIDYGRIGVFYRANAMSRVLEEELIKAAIPYQIVKGLEFFQRKEIKDLLAYLKLLANPIDEASLLRIVNRPARGIGDTTVRRIIQHGRAAGSALWDLFRNPAGVPELPAAAAAKIGRFVELMDGLRARTGGPVAETMKAAYERSGLRQALEDEENPEAAENIQELIHSAIQFDAGETAAGGLPAYLQQVALISDSDAYRDGVGAVSLMTLHTAKGLEFAAVMIVGVEDGIIPHSLSLADGRDDEEERRLLFVGITRAESHLALSHVQARTSRGASRPATLSPFLRGLSGYDLVIAPFMTNGFGGTGRSVSEPVNTGSRLYKVSSRTGEPGDSEISERARAKASGPVRIPLDAATRRDPGPEEASSGGFRAGQRVLHPAIGRGVIEKIISGSGGERAVVEFENGARLILDLRIAHLEAVD